jgi:hypothetical protein
MHANEYEYAYCLGFRASVDNDDVILAQDVRARDATRLPLGKRHLGYIRTKEMLTQVRVHSDAMRPSMRLETATHLELNERLPLKRSVAEWHHAPCHGEQLLTSYIFLYAINSPAAVSMFDWQLYIEAVGIVPVLM